MFISTLGICFKKLYFSSSKFRHSKNIRCFSHENNQQDPPQDYAKKYKVFKDEDADIIFDVEEERLKKQKGVEVLNENERTSLDQNVCEHSMEKIDVQELVEYIKSNKGQNVVVIKIPPDLKYADLMIICSGSSRRHINGVAELIRKHFKHKLGAAARAPLLEGVNSDWVALDLGNVIVHLMMDPVRKVYDLESLWGIGPKYDLKLNTKDDEVIELLKSHSISLDDLNPARSKPVMK